jgi:amino-acid N-acetyltransferase
LQQSLLILKMITYNIANTEEVEGIIHLLEQNNLPVLDIRESAIEFIVAKSNSKLIGCVGLEKQGDQGLLRSFAVESEFRNRSVGTELYHRILKHALQFNIKTMHLLTDTATEYFSKVGFAVTDRKNAPHQITETSEFSSLCPVSSRYMVLADITKYVK